MRIEGTMGLNTGMSVGLQGMDSVSKSIQKQIQSKQQELQKLSENDDLSAEEKMKKRQEIQKEIADLNNQLRMHQFEQRREKQQGKDTGIDDMLGGKKTQTKAQDEKSAGKSGKNSAGVSQASMQAIISADSSIKQAGIQRSTAVKMEGRAGVLRSEIKQDRGRGAAVIKKEEELADMETKAVNATAAQISTLGKANEALKEAGVGETVNIRKDIKDKKAENGEDENEPKINQPDEKTENEQEKQNGINALDEIYTHVNVLV